eukprot:scaffold214_cov249-Pinguiococcus_pyrenoidosus.AAC.34
MVATQTCGRTALPTTLAPVLQAARTAFRRVALALLRCHGEGLQRLLLGRGFQPESPSAGRFGRPSAASIFCRSTEELGGEATQRVDRRQRTITCSKLRFETLRGTDGPIERRGEDERARERGR